MHGVSLVSQTAADEVHAYLDLAFGFGLDPSAMSSRTDEVGARVYIIVGQKKKNIELATPFHES